MEQLTEIIKQLKPGYELNPETNLVEAGILDSFDIMNLVVELEVAYNIEISGEDIIPENFATIVSICNLIKKCGGNV